jgi:probable F420-dependent oxidoreductase
MEIGVVLPVEGDLAVCEAIVAAATEAERLGYDSVWTTDRLLQPLHQPSGYPYGQERGRVAFHAGRNWLDPIAVMGLVAGITSRIQIGTNVLVLPYRNPIVLAQEVASLDALSGGRIQLGVGVGWMAEEFAALGVPKTERGARTDEHIRLMRELWANPGGVTFRGRFSTVSDMTLAARPVRPSGPPILIGGNSAAALDRTARLGDGWAGVDLAPDDATATVAQLRELYEQHGRTMEGQVISLKRRLEPAAGVGGSAEIRLPAAQLTDELGRYGDAGITAVIYDLMMMPEPIAAIGWLASEVLAWNH